MKRAAIVNDISGFGKCSFTAALPVLATLGVEACPLPTAILSSQTGYNEFYCDDFTDRMPIYISKWKKLGVEFDAILTGYIANVKQVKIIEAFIKHFKKEKTIIIVDPVMADDGKIYKTYSEKMCTEVKKLALSADIITPNITELCVLSGYSYEALISIPNRHKMLVKIEELAGKIISDGVKTVIVTSIPINKGKTANGVFTKNDVKYYVSDVFEGSYSGTGDLFTATVCGFVTNGDDCFEAVEKATAFLNKAIEQTFLNKTDCNDGVNFEPFLKCL